MLAYQPNYVFDISLPIRSMDEYVAQLEEAVNERWPNSKVFSYGHVADGNLHIYDVVNQVVYTPLSALGGSISAEHGIGFSKKPWLSYTRNSAEIEIMQMLKKAFDPYNLLNAGRIVDLC